MSDCGWCGLPLREQFGSSKVVWGVEVCEADIELAEMCWEPAAIL